MPKHTPLASILVEINGWKIVQSDEQGFGFSSATSNLQQALQPSWVSVSSPEEQREWHACIIVLRSNYIIQVIVCIILACSSVPSAVRAKRKIVYSPLESSKLSFYFLRFYIQLIQAEKLLENLLLGLLYPQNILCVQEVYVCY